MALRRMTLNVLCATALISGMIPTFMQGVAQGEPGLSVSDGHVVSLEYTLTLKDHKVLDTNVDGAPLTYTQGASQIVPGLESALAGMKAGESKHVTVAAKDGYGEIDPQRVQEVPIEHIPPDARKVGTQLQGKDPHGRMVHPMVKEVKETMVVLDFNHPLAGKTLYFDVKVLDVQAGQGQEQ